MLATGHDGTKSGLFIAECKLWSSVKGFTDTTEQLFSYAAWRDTKLAIIMFAPASFPAPVPARYVASPLNSAA